MIHPILWFLAGLTVGKGKTDAVAGGCPLILASGFLFALIAATVLYLSHHPATLRYTFGAVLGGVLGGVLGLILMRRRRKD